MGAHRPAGRLTGARQGRRPEKIPVGFGVEFDPTVRQIGADLLIGGIPRRVLRLGPSGVEALAELRLGTVRTANGGALARRLVDAGLAHPRPPVDKSGEGMSSLGLSYPQVTVLIPVYGRADALDRCLAALGDAHPVVVVDDGSPDAAAIATVVAAHGAQLIPRALNGGPGAARNHGLAAIATEFVAFLDSDCVPPPGWIDDLAGHLADPMVAAVAPRIVSAPGAPNGARNALDLGTRPARVAPGTAVSYVPTAALLARSSALVDVSSGSARSGLAGGVFASQLRYGEDVDLVWRLHEAGWRIRYEPAVRVEHVEPSTWPRILARRFHYGSSAGALTRRHPKAMAPLILEPWTAAALGALLAKRPVLAAVALGGAVADETRARRTARVPPGAAGLPIGTLGAVADRTVKTWRASGTYATQFLAPVLLRGLVSRRTRFAATALLAAGPLHTWWTTRPADSKLAFAAGHVAEDVAYGAGVVAGAVKLSVPQAILPIRARRTSR